MKICILGDTHFGMRNDSILFHEFYKKFYDNIFFPYLIDNDIDVIFQLGDLFDRRKYINFNTLHMARKYFFDKVKENGMTLHILLGNHCVFYKNTLLVNSPNLLLKDYDNIHIYDEPETVNFDGVSVDVIPWMCLDNENEILNFIKKSKSQISFGHFEIDGFEMDRGNVCHGGMNKNLLENYDVVLSGHFHHKSSDGHITYVGTPGEMTWADHGDQRGFHVFDTDTREIDFVKNPFKIFHKISYDDTEQDFEYWKQYDYDNLKECYIKVIVVNKNNPYLFDNVIENLYKVGVADISIVEDFTEFEDENAEELIDQAEDTMTILSKYIDGLTLNVEPDKLKKIMRELYVESLTTEVIE